MVNDMDTPILMHISGPFGVGKTTLMRKLVKACPNIWFLELDNYEKDVKKELGLPDKWRRDHGWDKHRDQVRAVRRRRYYEDVCRAKASGKKIILFGNPFEGDDEIEYGIEALEKYVLVRPLSDIVRDRINRDSPDSLKDDKRYQYLTDHHTNQTKKHMSYFLDFGYTPIFAEDLERYVMSKYQSISNIDEDKIAHSISQSMKVI